MAVATEETPRARARLNDASFIPPVAKFHDA
jgi:hypothetical protein